MAPSSPDPRFQYSDTSPPGVKPADVDKMIAAVIDPTPGIIGVIGTAIKAGALLALMIVREKSQAAWAQYTKQQAEQSQANQNQEDANNALPPGATK